MLSCPTTFPGICSTPSNSLDKEISFLHMISSQQTAQFCGYVHGITQGHVRRTSYRVKCQTGRSPILARRVQSGQSLFLQTTEPPPTRNYHSRGVLCRLRLNARTWYICKILQGLTSPTAQLFQKYLDISEWENKTWAEEVTLHKTGSQCFEDRIMGDMDPDRVIVGHFLRSLHSPRVCERQD